MSIGVFILIGVPTLVTFYLLLRWTFRAIPYIFKEADLEVRVAAIRIRLVC